MSGQRTMAVGIICVDDNATLIADRNDPGFSQKLSCVENFAYSNRDAIPRRHMLPKVADRLDPHSRLQRTEKEAEKDIFADRLNQVMKAMGVAMRKSTNASDRLRKMLETFIEADVALFLDDRKSYDIAASAMLEPQPLVRAFERYVKNLITEIVTEGREDGEFECNTPLDETSAAIYLVMRPHISPALPQYSLQRPQEMVDLLADVMLKSLSH